MKKYICFAILLVTFLTNAQNSKPDFSKLTTLDMVKVSVHGVDLQNNIWQDSLVKLKELKLRGTDADNFIIVYFKFKTNYKKTLSVDEFYNEKIPVPMTQFFTDLESNCKVSFEDIVIKHKENGKLFKISPLSFIIKT
jgi:hypothetical protein